MTDQSMDDIPVALLTKGSHPDLRVDEMPRVEAEVYNPTTDDRPKRDYGPREYRSLTALRQGKVLDLDGILLVKADGEIEPGDLYIAERNTGPNLLEAQRIDTENGYIVPTSRDYPFDLSECVKVKEA